MFCSRCGRKAHSKDAFCGLCGLAIPWSSVRIAIAARARHNEDRFFKYALIGVPVFVLSLLAIVFYETSSDGERHVTAPAIATPAATPTHTESPTISPLSEPTPENKSTMPEVPQVAAQPALSADEIRRLAKERQYAIDMITALESMLATQTVSDRAEIYCRFTVDKTYELMGSGSESNQQVQDFARNGNIRSCIGRILIGYQTMPDLDELREKAVQAREHVMEIDQKLAAPK
jgi:hypothetical protein